MAKMKASAKKPAKKAAKAAPAKAMPAKAAAAKMVVKKSMKPEKPKNGRTLSYTQSEFIEQVRAFCGFEKRSQAREVCEDIALFIKESMRRGYKIPLLGLGKLYVRTSKARVGRNPATGEPIQIPSKKRVRFTPAKSFKDSVLSKM
jgi:nucleoid DNA-binding protein